MPLRWAEAAVLLALGTVVAVPLTTWLARVRWTAREPVAALVAWQAIGLSGGLAVLTAELTLASANEHGAWLDAVWTGLTSPGSIGVVGWVGLVLLALSLLWLVGVLATSFARVIRSRREHRALVELLSRPGVARDARSGVARGTPPGLARDAAFDVIDADTPVAYSLPGRTSHVVVSTAAIATLTGAELCAVLAHERAHLRQRHSILVQPFIAWQRSLPFLASPAAARARVEQLVEIVCDDAARRTADPAALASALIALAPDGSGTAERLARLRSARQSSVALRAGLACGALVLVVLPPVLLLTAA